MTDENSVKPVRIYATNWCGDCARARRFFDDHSIDYVWVDIDSDMNARKFVENTNNGFRSVPTIVFPDGSILVEPRTIDLNNKFGF